MSSYYNDGVQLGNAMFGVLAILFLISMAMSGSFIGIVGLIMLVLSFIYRID